MASEPFDIVVIGGGITGTGAALDAATRGLSVALVEARDYAAGTSSRSSKLIHGGLRYLEQRNFGLVREALKERRLLLQRLAPHLVRPVPFLFPLTHSFWERAYVGLGVLLYDRMGGGGAVPGHRHLSRRAALKLAPALRPDALVGAIQYYDGQFDDARFVVTVARTAALYGAAMATSARVIGLLRDGGRIIGVRVRDLETTDELDVRALVVINATGVWTDELLEKAGAGGAFKVRASKGIHLLVPHDRIKSTTGLILRTETSVLFVIPWGRHWLIGTTDTDWKLDKAHPAASRADIDYLLERVNRVLVNPLSHADIVGVYAGLRPLLAGESDATSKLSREHAVARPVPGLVVIAGGKNTTYRVMANEVVNAAVSDLGRQVPPSATESTPLVGAVGYEVASNARERLAAKSRLPVPRIDRLLSRYGSQIHELLDLIAERPELGQPISEAEDYLAVEALYAASHEGALHLDDVLTRRTHISIETWDRGVGAAEPVARLVADALGWDDAAIGREVEHYHARVAAERESQEQPDDHTADAARLGAPDVRMPVAASAGIRR
jgi:glycerol-3-phosphate dehydrogenase